MWYELLRYFSRKELVKLQSTNKFFDKAIRELKLPALHVINKLKIVMDDDEDGQDAAAACFVAEEDSSGNIVRHIQVEYFSPPNYVRFYEVVLIIFVPSADFLERLKQHKASFTDSVFLLHETDIETMTFLLREIFTECQHITMHLDEWTATSQQKIFSLTGLHNCNSVNLQSDQMMLHPEDPLVQSMLDWLHISRGNERKWLILKNFDGCESFFQQLMKESILEIIALKLY